MPAAGVTGPRVVLDCDPGHDDAIAMVVAAAYADLVGVTTVSGNAALEMTTRNAIVIADTIGYGGPVVQGAYQPISNAPVHAPNIHGLSGLDGPRLPEPTRVVDGVNAGEFLARKCDPDTWLVATGPLTNVAAAIRLDPGFASRIAGISLMGGSTSFGNISAAAEFNIWADPEAADIVFASGARVRMCGLNLTHQVLIDPSFVESIKGIGGTAASFLAETLAFFLEAYSVTWPTARMLAPLHDPCAVLAVTHPALFEFKCRHVGVELSGVLTRGMTVVDQRELTAVPSPNVEVGEKVNVDRVLHLIRYAVERLSSRQ